MLLYFLLCNPCWKSSGFLRNSSGLSGHCFKGRAKHGSHSIGKITIQSLRILLCDDCSTLCSFSSFCWFPCERHEGYIPVQCQNSAQFCFIPDAFLALRFEACPKEAIGIASWRYPTGFSRAIPYINNPTTRKVRQFTFYLHQKTSSAALKSPKISLIIRI